MHYRFFDADVVETSVVLVLVVATVLVPTPCKRLVRSAVVVAPKYCSLAALKPFTNVFAVSFKYANESSDAGAELRLCIRSKIPQPLTSKLVTQNAINREKFLFFPSGHCRIPPKKLMENKVRLLQARCSPLACLPNLCV